jgi:drug/metabolite transporter (DMT)-like permease
MNRNLARIILITAGFIWGLGFMINKFVLDSGWNDAQLLFVRFFVATIAIFIVFFKRIKNAWRKTIYPGFFLGIFLYLGFLFQTWGLVHTTASNNALITASYIFMMPIIIYIAEKKHVKKQTIFAGILVVIGISLISVDFKELTIALGDALTFVGAFFYAFHIYFLGKKSKEKDPFVLMAFQLLIFSVFAFVMMMIRGGFPEVDFQSIDSIKVLLFAALIGFFGSFIGFVFQSVGQKNTYEAEAAILISTESVFGPVLAIIFYNDPMNEWIILGIIFVFIGIVLSEISFDKVRLRIKK